MSMRTLLSAIDNTRPSTNATSDEQPGRPHQPALEQHRLLDHRVALGEFLVKLVGPRNCDALCVRNARFPVQPV